MVILCEVALLTMVQFLLVAANPEEAPIRAGLPCAEHTPPLSALLLQEPHDGALAAGDLIAGTVSRAGELEVLEVPAVPLNDDAAYRP